MPLSAMRSAEKARPPEMEVRRAECGISSVSLPAKASASARFAI